MDPEARKPWADRIKAEKPSAKPPTQVTGTLTVTHPTVDVLALLFAWFIADKSEFDPRQMAEIVMEAVGHRDAAHQIGPGLEVITQEGQSTAVLNWDCWFTNR